VFISIVKSTGLFVFVGIGVIIVYVYVVHLLTIKRLDYNKYFETIKENYIKTILKYVDASFEYHDGPLPFADVENSGLFKKKWAKEDHLAGQDYFEGIYKGVKVKISEIDFIYSENRKVDASFKRSVLVVADFNKHIHAETYVYEPAFGDGDSSVFILSNPAGEKLILENNEFEKLFVTTSTDEIEGRYFLSHSFMERMLELKRMLRNNALYVSFSKSKVSILIHGKLLFEPNLSRSLKDDKTFIRFYNETLAILKIIDVLRLNDTIWKDNQPSA
jgi:hypothetical protein